MEFDQRTKDILCLLSNYLVEIEIVSNLKLEFGILPNCPDEEYKDIIHLKIGQYDYEKCMLFDHTHDYTEFTIFIFDTYEKNLLYAQKSLNAVYEYNSARYNRLIPYQLDDERIVVFAFLHEIGHCVYMNQIQKQEGNCPDDVLVKGLCNTCPYRFRLEKMNCNNVHENAADNFAIKHLDGIMRLIINHKEE